MPLDRTFAILGRSTRLKPRTGTTLSGASGGDIQEFVDGLDTVVGELRSRRANSASLDRPTKPRPGRSRASVKGTMP
jgi:hypothetical protein